MLYKSNDISFLIPEIKVKNLCVYNDFYYFDSNAEIANAEIVSIKEFEEAKASVMVAESLPVEPTQLDRIQQAVEKSNDELRQEGAEAVTLELIERGVL